jgi:sporulation protein YlmC with PRC-barrel domain
MTRPRSLDLALGVLDHQLLDCEGRRCGKVDDLELDGVGEGKPCVSALVVGPPAWNGRGPLGRMAARLGRGRTVHVDWGEVEDVGSAVHLRRAARELRLGAGDDRVRPWIERLPGSR